MREGTLAVAVAKGPDVRIGSAQAFVDLDVAALVGLDAGGVEAEVVRVGHPAHGEQQMRAPLARRAFPAAEADGYAVRLLLYAQAFGAQAQLDAFRAQDFLDRGR